MSYIFYLCITKKTTTNMCAFRELCTNIYTISDDHKADTNLSRTLISLPGNVAIPSFQSKAPIMSNSAPWEGPSLGGVSVIPTPPISPTCKDVKQATQKLIMYWQLTHKIQQMFNKQAQSTSLLQLGELFSLHSTDCAQQWGTPLYGFTYKVLPPTNAVLPALVNSTAQHHH